MPDVIVFNLPNETSQEKLAVFYEAIVGVISIATEVDRSWVHPLFPASMLKKNPDVLINAFVIINELEKRENADGIAENTVYKLGNLIQETFGSDKQAAVKVISQKKEWQHFFEAKA